MGKKEEIERRQEEICLFFRQNAGREVRIRELLAALELPSRMARTVRNDIEELRGRGFPVEQTRRGYYCYRGRGDTVIRREVRAGRDELRRLRILTIVADGGKMTAKGIYKHLTQVVSEEEISISRDTCRRDLRFLLAGGFLSQEGDKYRLGPKLLPVLRPFPQEVELVLHELNCGLEALGSYDPIWQGLIDKLRAYCNTFAPDAEEEREQEGLFYFHGPWRKIKPRFLETLKLVTRAVLEGKRVRIIYNGREVLLYPLGLVYNQSNYRWYLLGRSKRRKGGVTPFLIERMEAVEVLPEEVPAEMRMDTAAVVAPAWGIGTGRREKVKVIFYHRYNTVANALTYIKRRQHFYPFCRYTFDAEGNLLLEDEIAGVEEFLCWLRQFGYNAEILAPESLREEMRRSLEKLAQLYPEVNDDELQ
ncbi:MAG: hypothetical protein PWQ31_1300 [Eubacteriales bacterium]|nr:hypothetical protein [Eubacteriales bacterium]